MKETDNRSILFLQTLGIFLVVLGHSLPQDYQSSFLFKAIYMFHMPLFVFISGYLYQAKSARYQAMGYRSFIGQKAVRLLIPYIVISTIAFFPKAILSRFAVRPNDISLASFLHGLIIPGDNPIVFFWFLPTIFLIFAIFYPATKILRKLPSQAVFVLLAVLLVLDSFIPVIRILNLSGVLHYAFYFGLGACYLSLESLSKDLKNRTSYLLCSLVFFVAYLLIIGFDLGVASPMPMAVLGIGAVVLLSLSLGDVPLKLLGAYSFQIYLLSWFPQVAFRIIFYDSLHISPFLGVPLSTTITLGCSVLVAQFVDKRIHQRALRSILGL